MVCENQTAMLASMNNHGNFQGGASRRNPPITVNQLRAGRAIARLGIRELASAAGLSATAISHLENGHTRNPHSATMLALRAALTAHGVDFAGGGWTRHLADAHGGQCSPPSSTSSVQVGHADDDGPDDDRPDADTGHDGPDDDGPDDDRFDDDDGEPNGPDWRELCQWLKTAWDD